MADLAFLDSGDLPTLVGDATQDAMRLTAWCAVNDREALASLLDQAEFNAVVREVQL